MDVAEVGRSYAVGWVTFDVDRVRKGNVNRRAVLHQAFETTDSFRLTGAVRRGILGAFLVFVIWWLSVPVGAQEQTATTRGRYFWEVQG